jgi:hypothetical protein
MSFTKIVVGFLVNQIAASRGWLPGDNLSGCRLHNMPCKIQQTIDFGSLCTFSSARETHILRLHGIPTDFFNSGIYRLHIFCVNSDCSLSLTVALPLLYNISFKIDSSLEWSDFDSSSLKWRDFHIPGSWALQ